MAAGILQENFSATIEGDIHCRLVQRNIHAACTQERCLIVAGIPCQPYSVQGLQGGLWDDRGQVLFPVLRIAWLAQASGLVLECVSEIQSRSATLAVLHRCAWHSGFRIHQIVLDLSHQWASRTAGSAGGVSCYRRNFLFSSLPGLLSPNISQSLM